jgi:hypothetical protein
MRGTHRAEVTTRALAQNPLCDQATGPRAPRATLALRMDAGSHEEGVNLTDPEWRALIYVASKHDFSAPHLRLERDDEAVDIDAADAKELRSALGKALEVREIEEIRTPDGELAYDTIQRVRHVLLSEGVRLARTPAW